MRLKQFLVCVTSAIAITSMSTVAFAGAVTSKEEISISTTGGGIKIKSDNGNSFSIGGRIMYDYDSYDDAYNADNDGDSGSESEFRRTRVSLKGTSGQNWAYKLTVDIDDDDNEADVDTAYIKYQGFNNVDLLLGRLNAPAGLEELTSSKNISTIERSITTSDFNTLTGKPDFQAQAQAYTGGLMGASKSGNLFGQLALIDEGFEDSDTQDKYSWALRAGGHYPFAEEKHFIHAAVSYADREFGDDGNFGFETEGGVHALPGDLKVQDDDDFAFDNADQIGVELAYVQGPFSAQAEYYSLDFDGGNNAAAAVINNDLDVNAYYALLSFFLTGESRPYKGKVGKFDKIKPKGPLGALELVAKYEDGEIDPDNQSKDSRYELLTLGVNWYATQNVKFMLNYLDLDTDEFDSEAGIPLTTLGEEDGNAVSFRAQYAF